MMKRKLQHRNTAILSLMLAAVMLGGCATSNMPKRKKSRCNTCPKFSYIDTYKTTPEMYGSNYAKQI